ncbi:MAG TPA: hypothetical protein PLG22_07165 [Kiritimatiellia bacterium]|nr:hypothetical protein [Kiritimatiellia bacterium]
MAWSANIAYYLVSRHSGTTFGTESKTLTFFNISSEPNPSATDGGTHFVRVPYEVDYDRSVKTVLSETVYECRGVEEAAAAAAVSSVGNYDPVTGSYAQTVVTADRCNEAGGWMVRKTVTEVTVTRGAWQAHQEAT